MYELNHRVRYSEITPNRCVNMEQVVKYFQDCSTFQSDSIGRGLDYMEQEGYAWMLAAWQVEARRYPVMGEEIVIATWPYDAKGILAYRNFEIRDFAGERLVSANSIWFYMNIKTGIPKKIEQEDIEGYGTGEKLPMDYKPRKIKLPKIPKEPMEDFPVKKADLDTNEHVNNARYIEMAMEYMEGQICSMRADYRKAAMYGDRIFPVLYRESHHTWVELANKDGEPYVVIEFETA